VAADDTLASVAREFHVSDAALAEANQLHPTDSLQGVEALAVPLAPVAAPSTRMLLYVARRGDTLVTIADRFGVSLTQLRRWNNIAGVKVEPGRRLHVAEPAVASHPARSRHGAATSSGKAAEQVPAKSDAHKAGAPAAKKQPATSGSGNSHAPKSHSISPAAKNAPSKNAASTRRRHSAKRSAQAKSSTP